MTQSNVLDTVYDDTWNLPINGSRIHVMVQNPTTLLVYWQIHTLKRRLLSEHFRTAWSELPLHLRIRDVTGTWYDGYNALWSRDIVVDAYSTHWYVGDVEPGRNFLAEIGTLTWDQQFFAVLRSNVVETPRLPASDAVFPSVRFSPLHGVSWFQMRVKTASASGVLTCDADVSTNSDGPSYPFMSQFDGYSVVERGVHDGK